MIKLPVFGIFDGCVWLCWQLSSCKKNWNAGLAGLWLVLYLYAALGSFERLSTLPRTQCSNSNVHDKFTLRKRCPNAFSYFQSCIMFKDLGSSNWVWLVQTSPQDRNTTELEDEVLCLFPGYTMARIDHFYSFPTDSRIETGNFPSHHLDSLSRSGSAEGKPSDGCGRRGLWLLGTWFHQGGMGLQRAWQG